MTPDEARALFALSTTDGELLLEDAWRRERSLRHPDRPGGSADAFAAARKAYDLLRAEFRRPRRCPECDGAGTIPKQHGWTVLTVRCPVCKGAKTLTPGEAP